MPQYLISTGTGAVATTDIIHDVETKLKIKAINLVNSVFTPSKAEVSFFVTAGDKKIAFETSGYQRHKQELILHMISWYCIYSGWVNIARIHSTWPN